MRAVSMCNVNRLFYITYRTQFHLDTEFCTRQIKNLGYQKRGTAMPDYLKRQKKEKPKKEANKEYKQSNKEE